MDDELTFSWDGADEQGFIFRFRNVPAPKTIELLTGAEIDGWRMRDNQVLEITFTQPVIDHDIMTIRFS